jgi:hypothetical protein
MDAFCVVMVVGASKNFGPKIIQANAANEIRYSAKSEREKKKFRMSWNDGENSPAINRHSCLVPNDPNHQEKGSKESLEAVQG